MELRAIDAYFLYKEEPEKSYLLALREIILAYNKNITPAWKYGMPFFCYKGKMFCYLWTHKKYKQPYIGFVEGNKMHHPQLIQEKRARMKIILLDPNKDIPLRTIRALLKETLAIYDRAGAL